MSSIPLLPLFCSLILVNACGQSSIQSSFTEYQNQVGEELNISILLNTENPSLHYPSSQQMKLDIPETTMNLRDFYALKHCPVFTLIAQRNTALGKVQLPSQRFAYEVKLIQGLNECLQQTDDEQQQQQLTQWLEDKYQTLPKVWAQMVLSSAEIRRSLSTNSTLFTQISNEQLRSYQASLSLIVNLYSPTMTDIDGLEAALNTLRQQPLPAQIWYTQNQLSFWLNNLADRLQSEFAKISCQSASSAEQIANLKLIYEQNFIADILPVIGRLAEVHHMLEPNFKTLRNNPVLLEPFKKFLIQRKLESENYLNARHKHEKVWQNLFIKCNSTNQKV
ncbi:DUF3080 family protein [Alteromonas sp. M12]|uniref:DUF3080 family protein n=1 Tax=Alteromonas sp. M12 TaxID=3135644 RepID=UPI00319E0F34